MKKFTSLLILLVVGSVSVNAKVKLPALVGSNMVLQQNSTLKIWGWACPKESITLSTNWDSDTYTTIASQDSIWEIMVSTPQAGGPYSMTIEGTNTINLTNILLGEVWVCSGQSNMEKPLGPKGGQLPTFNSEEELKIANFPQIRLFHVPRKKIASVQNDIESEWVACTPEALLEKQFSAVAYFYGKTLQKKLNVPIGLIDASWGGTRIEPWTPIEGLKKYSALDSIYQIALKVTNEMNKHHPTLLYNGMIAPLTNYTIAGWIWYQGESNLFDVNDGLFYEVKMKALIDGWRHVWENESLPFYYVQIAPYRYYEDRSNRVASPNELPLIWEAQSNSLKIPHTGMAVITDLVDDLSDIHPRNKEDVGKRLAAIALAQTYGKKVAYSGPHYKSFKIKKNKIIVSFNFADKGLISADNRALNYFTIAGKDQQFHTAEAQIKGKKVIVSSPEVQHPIAVRFAWDESATPNLKNKSELPATPFRTDSWEP